MSSFTQNNSIFSFCSLHSAVVYYISIDETMRITFVMFAGKLCIEVAPADKIAFISEELCIGCGICAKAS